MSSTMFNFAKDNPLDFNNIQLLKDNSNEPNNNDNAKGQLQWASTLFNCSRTTPMSSTTIAMPKNNSNGLQSTFAKDNFLDLEKLAQLTMICCSQLEDRQSLL